MSDQAGNLVPEVNNSSNRETDWSLLCQECNFNSNQMCVNVALLQPEDHCFEQSTSNEHNLLADDRIIRLQKSCLLRFVVDTTLVTSGQVVRLFTDHPTSFNSSRSFRELVLQELACGSAITFAEVKLTVAGLFTWYYTLDESDSIKLAKGRGHFLVDPELIVGHVPKRIPIEGIVCQSVLSKNLGSFPTWFPRLMVAEKTGYNAIHFTPLQELGDSNSAYALRDLFKLNPSFGADVTFTDVAALVEDLCKEHNMLSFTDLVLNHIANESEWLLTHPNCTYNLKNSMYLKPAYLFDQALARFSQEIANGKWNHENIPAEISCEEHLIAIKNVLEQKIIPDLRLWEFYQLNIEESLTDIRHQVDLKSSVGVLQPSTSLCIQFDSKSTFERFGGQIDVQLAAELFCRSGEKEFSHMHKILHELNLDAEKTTRTHLRVAVSNVVSEAWNRFVNPSGLQLTAVNKQNPLVNRYFFSPIVNVDETAVDDEQVMHSKSAIFIWAHSGWLVQGIDPCHKFAEFGSNVYLRRELNSWVDTVKLRYGADRYEYPELWDYMRNYAVSQARIFHGIRLDNCHCTPLPVAKYIIENVRSVRPDIFVFAELYASTLQAASHIASYLGLNAVISGTMDVSSPQCLANRLNDCGGMPLGSFIQQANDRAKSSRQFTMLFDQTHDDPSPLERRSAYDLPATAALLAGVVAPIGSNRGYDEAVPHEISVIREKRSYRMWNLLTGRDPDCINRRKQDLSTDGELVSYDTGIILIRKTLNELHYLLATAGFDQVDVEMLSEDIVSITRYNSQKYEACTIIARCAFSQSDLLKSDLHHARSLTLPGVVKNIRLQCSVDCQLTQYRRHSELINGLYNYRVNLETNVNRSDANFILIRPVELSVGIESVELVNFKPGSVVALDIVLCSEALVACKTLDRLLLSLKVLIGDAVFAVISLENRNAALIRPIVEHCFKHRAAVHSAYPRSNQSHSMSPDDVSRYVHELIKITEGLSAAAAAVVLYDAAAENEKWGVYNIPNYGNLCFHGLAGLIPVFKDIREHKSSPVRHALGQNMCSGNWLLDYMVNRLVFHPETKSLGDWLWEVFLILKAVPGFLVPRYFEAIVSYVCVLVSTRL